MFLGKDDRLFKSLFFLIQNSFFFVVFTLKEEWLAVEPGYSTSYVAFASTVF